MAAISLNSFAWAQEETDKQNGKDLTALGIEDLMKVEVVSASKTAQPLKNVPAAIYVLTTEDIKRSGATNIPDMLRLVPGVQVAQIDGNKWMVSIRGFNSHYADKLQVLVDGQSVYTPTFNGVNWDELNLPPHDIERIEVIRGPGGAIWGANAINGVINIITKSATQTHGAQVDAGVGDPTKSLARIQYGSALGSHADYRVYAEQTGYSNLDPTLKVPANDKWSAFRGGFRLDGGKGSESYMVTGYTSKSNLNELSLTSSFSPPYGRITPSTWTAANSAFNASWKKDSGEGSSSELRASYTTDNRHDPATGEVRNTADLDYRSSTIDRGGGHQTWGLTYRHNVDQTKSNDGLSSFDPATATKNTFGGFYQYEHGFRNNLQLTIGSTAEHNDFTGWEFQPSARLLWAKNESESYWMGLSRAEQTPSRSQTGGRFPMGIFPGAGGQLVELVLIGDKSMPTETLTAFEVGARYQPTPKLMFEATAFLNYYQNLDSFKIENPFFVMSPVPHVEIDYKWGGKVDGLTGGLEFNSQILPCKNWKLGLNASFFTEALTQDPGFTDGFGLHGPGRMGATPAYTVSMLSSHDLGRGLTFDWSAIYTSAEPSVKISALARVDARLAWKLHNGLELSFVGQNLFTASHVEGFSISAEVPSQVRRSYLLSASWKF